MICRGRHHLPLRLCLRERLHRFSLFAGVGAMVALALSPILGHHLTSDLGSLATGTNHWGDLCLVALHRLLAPVHDLFHLLLAAGLLYALWDRITAWRMVRATLARVDAFAARPRPGELAWDAVAAAGLAAERVRVVPGLPNPAFTVGALRPRVYLAKELAEWLSADELAAVIAHEAAHLRRRDPLRLAALRFLECTFFWLPPLRPLAAHLAEEVEIVADDCAVRAQPLVLARALLRLAQWPGLRGPAGAVAYIAQPDLLERRVRRLLGEAVAPAGNADRRALLSGLLALGMLWASTAAMLHPLPAPTTGPRAACQHQDLGSVQHLAHHLLGALAHVDLCPHDGDPPELLHPAH